MSENSYQNQDLESQNPLRVSMDTDTTPSESTSPKKGFSLPQDPKIKLLVVLFAVVIFLFALSLIISIIKGSKSTTTRIQPTPILTATQLPTDVPSDDKIPTDLKTKFNKADGNSQINILFSPPQIDPDVGL